MITPAPVPPNVIKFQKWHRVVLNICLIIFAGELGFCLLVLPWGRSWEMSYVPMHNPSLAGLWMSPYFRGLLSGLGLLNVYVALSETGRLFRVWISKHNPS
jgi:hypothetical protein